MGRVFVEQVRHYDASVEEIVFRMLDSMEEGEIQRGSRVLIKPNLLTPASPESAILTHPAIVRSVVKYVLEKGGRPQISDSPAFGSFRRVVRKSGIQSMVEDLDVKLSEFETSVEVTVGNPFHTLEVAHDVFRADMVINLPKFKTHSQMLLTLGVKNLFGCIVGLRKPEWHLRAGMDREMFARLLVRVYEIVRPSITLLDGVIGLEGQGPSFGGVPRHIGVLMGSRDGVALDMAVCAMLGIDPDHLLTNKVAREFGLAPVSIQVEGDCPEIHDFKLPEISTLLFGPPQFHGFFRRHLLQRPVADLSQCKSCGECWQYCPAGAINPRDMGIDFDYDRCIRCYCCIEVCRQGALHTEEPLLGQLLSRLQEWGVLKS